MSDVLLGAFRHDAHKFFGESHGDARSEFAGVPVNRSVPAGADGDAAALSRPQQPQEKTVSTHDTHYRLSLLTGESAYGENRSNQIPDVQGEFSLQSIESEVRDLLNVECAETAHRRWLSSDVVAGFNESVYHPYTSLKYHTLLVAALLDNYRDGYEFADLGLIVDSAGDVVPFRTIFDGSRFALRIDGNGTEQPSACLGSRPWRSWSSTWNRLAAHPLDTNYNKYDMTLDANFRRIQSWSSALQYLEDFNEWRPDR